MHAFETEVAAGQEFKNIIVARVTKVEKHPNADRLRVITLTDGTKSYYPVVCGAWNFDVGAVVPLALPGATIPHDQHDPEGKAFVLGKATIRGVESQGMICSGKELGLTDDGRGIMLLGREHKVGETFTAKGGEVYLDISTPANRPDVLGYFGIAREISALTGSKLAFREPRNDLSKLRAKTLKVNIASSKLCSRYLAVKLGNLEVGPSPQFIQDRLRLSGHRPINNVVDITNYVMLETGQPLHAFDSSKVLGSINIRPAYVNEKITTLDTAQRTLSPSNLVIADSKHAVAIAGVMGGASSMIDAFTNEIILESANFDAVSVRKTSRELNLRTDASARFEKSLPPALADAAATYAVELFIKFAGATPLEFVMAGGKLPPQKKIHADAGKINSLLGTKLPAAEQKKILGRLGFEVKTQKKSEALTVTVPYWRTDAALWQDLAEEIARFQGLDYIDSTPPKLAPSDFLSDPNLDLERSASGILASLGYSQIYTYSFVTEKDLKSWDIEHKIVVEVANPLTPDQQYMRPNILVTMMKAAEYNSRLQASGNYFEFGHIYWKDGKQILEKNYLGIIGYDKDYPAMKAVSALEELGNRLRVKFTIEQDSEQLATIKIDKTVVGHIGHVPVGDFKWVGVHLDFEEFIRHIAPKEFEGIIKYPAISRDVAVWARVDLPWGKVEQLVRSMNHEIIRSVELFDIYSGKNAPRYKKSMAFRIVYQSPQRTLTEPEVEAIHTQVLKELKARLNLEVR